LSISTNVDESPKEHAMDITALPVVVVGAGTTGLAAAAHLLERDIDVVVLEAGASPAAGVRRWGHVRLFSPWAHLVDEAAARLLDRTGWSRPEPSAYPTGAEWVDRYLQPLAQALGPEVVRTDHRVLGVTRQGRDLMHDAGRADAPLVVRARTGEGSVRLLARALVDASGTTASPSPIGADGHPADGEHAAEAEGRITREVPDLGDARTRAAHAGAHTVVVGAGHSAQTAVVRLADLAADEPGTRVTWVLRRTLTPTRVGGGAGDALPQRGALGQAAARAVDDGLVGLVEGFRTGAIASDGDHLELVAEDGQRIPGIDRLVGLTGYRPDLGLTAELRIDLDPSVQAPRPLAPLIDPNVHSCGTVPPHGQAELAHPEPDVYWVGMKSYGRAPTFLALTGYEQVRSIAAHLAGDAASARRVELVLPETGVCSGGGLDDGADDACVVPASSVPEQPIAVSCCA
jgi:hypothetical protein